MLFRLFALPVAVAIGAIALAVAPLDAHAAPKAPAKAKTAYDFTFTSIDGAAMPLSAYKGQVLLVVNTASFCGFTKQYDGLEKLYDRLKGRGLVVIGVPSNDFGDQEPGSAKEIKEFCETRFDISFPMSDKQVVTGDKASPFYRWARSTLGWMNAPKWNFHKYLVGRDGKLIDGFGSLTEPDSPKLVAAIEAALKK
jgi:glutathione peroxidase